LERRGVGVSKEEKYCKSKDDHPYLTKEERMESEDEVQGSWMPTIVVLFLLALKWLATSDSAITYRRQLQMLVSIHRDPYDFNGGESCKGV
jgi:hypothetical protein